MFLKEGRISLYYHIYFYSERFLPTAVIAENGRLTAHRAGPFATAVVVVVVTFFNHNFVNCKATSILAIKIYELKYNISLNDIHT